MREGHAPDDCRHIETYQPLMGIFLGHRWVVLIAYPQGINTLIAACRTEDAKHTNENQGEDPLT
jgi:hypothetical protein